MAKWRFYGRDIYTEKLKNILSRDLFYFVKIEGRRRIGKSKLIIENLDRWGKSSRSFRVQIPDAEPGGLITTIRNAADVMYPGQFNDTSIKNLHDVASLIGKLIDRGEIVVLDEFQYLNRERLRPLLSYLQEVVDARKGTEGIGGLIVAGSIHTEMKAILENKDSPLYGRITDKLTINHFTPAAIKEVLSEHCEYDPLKLLFFYTLLEGVPKYYEDVFERGLFSKNRKEIIEGLFFDTSAPLSSEAETWFLSGLKGRYLTIIEALAARKGFATSNEIKEFLINSSASDSERSQIGVYIETLINNYKIIERQHPIFVNKKSRHTRYAICDNFLRTWIHAIKPAYQAKGYRPLSSLLSLVDQRISNLEGLIFEKLVRELIYQRSRESILDFNLTDEISGYWNHAQFEIDQIFIDRDNKIVRFGSCKRNPSELLSEIETLRYKIEKLMKRKPFSLFQSYHIEYLLFSPEKNRDLERTIARKNMAGVVRHFSLNDLIEGTKKD